MMLVSSIYRAKRRHSADEKQTRRKPSKISLLLERLSETYFGRGGAVSVVNSTPFLERNVSDPMLPRPLPLNKEEPAISGDVPDLTVQISIDTYRPIFEGTYSSIYRGTYRNHKVAIKAIRAVKHGGAMRKKIRAEMEIWCILRHPNILPCMGYVDTEGLGEYGAIVSLWCKNGNALDYLQENPTSSQRVGLLLDVARGLQYLHEFNPTIVHGDLKPANVLFDDSYTAKLCDFGLVRLIQADGSSTGMTTTSAHTETARYLAYELVESDHMPTTTSDIYALGCLGLEFLFSRHPHAEIQNDQGNAHFKICQEIARGTPPAPRPHGLDGIMTSFWNLLESCWEMRIAERPAVAKVVKYLEQSSQDLVSSRDRMVRYSSLT